MSIRIKTISAISLLLALGACTPHPGGGGWHAISDNAAFERLEIRYDGRADFYTRNDDNMAAWRCFWGAADKQTASLKCVDAGNTDNEQVYLFLVEEGIKEGTLKLGDRVMGRYGWQPPTEPASE